MASASARYAALSAARTTVLERARDAARLTIPGIIPDDGANEHTIYAQPYQSVSARGVASLASYLLLAMFPPNLPFYRLGIDEETAEQAGAELTEANERLSRISRTTYALMGSSSLRPVLMEVLRHLIVAGNVLLYIPDKLPPRLYRLDQYVVKRDAGGRFLDIITLEKVLPSTLTPEVRAATGLDKPSQNGEQPVEVYTVVERRNGQVQHWQEINNKEVPGSRGGSPEDKTGWLPLRWLAIPGSDYGRGHVTEYIGDIMSLEDLSKAMVQFAGAAARILNIVDPNSGLDIEELAAAETGDYLHGYADRIKTLQLDKTQDWSVMATLAERIEKRVAAAFLIRADAIRDAERVTAEEVSLIAQELETILGGTYTVLSGELQLPLVQRYLYIGARQRRIPSLPNSVSPTIVTGFDALGRGTSVNRLRAWVRDAKEALGSRYEQVIIADELARRLGDGVEDLDGLIKSPEAQAEDAQNAQLSAAADKATPAIAKAAAEAAVQPQT